MGLPGVPYMKHPGKADTIQHYDPRAIPQIQYNKVKYQGQCPQTSINYPVTQNSVTNQDIENEMDTETAYEADTEYFSDVEEHDVFDILNDIHLTFNYLMEKSNRKLKPNRKSLMKRK